MRKSSQVAFLIILGILLIHINPAEWWLNVALAFLGGSAITAASAIVFSEIENEGRK